ncbi:MAG: HlyC/CorC family transporter [Bacteroidetes bacterium]|nr:HlyC/CorC family transporter [Bacteroidota bacterium]
MFVLIVLCILILLLSFLASSMEAALFSVTPIEIEQMMERRLPGAQRLRANKEDIQESIVAIVILNNLSNIAGSILVGALAVEVFGELWVGIFSAILTFIIILLGEVLPKTIGERYAAGYARGTARLVFLLRVVFKPLVLLINMLARPFGGKPEMSRRLSEDEIKVLARMSHRHGSILETENILIRRVLQLDDIMARDIMTPRTVVFALKASDSLADVAEQLYDASVSRIPLYEEDLDNIVGLVHIRDLLTALAKGRTEKLLREFADEVSFVPDTVRVNVLLSDFQKNREHLSVVVDEHGGMAGVITLEDILEQLVGEIVDEHDRDVDLRVRARMLQELRSGRPRDYGMKR